MKHFMLDFETLGLSNQPVITSMTITEFNILTGETLAYDEMAVDARSCIAAGGKIDGETLEWWLKQDSEVFKQNVLPALEGSEIAIGSAIEQLIFFINRRETEYFRIWSNGLLADAKWLESYVTATKIKVPWKYWQFNDVRTLVDLGWQILGVDYKKETPFTGQKHNSLHDCQHQALYVSKIWRHFYDRTDKRMEEAP
jgi:hypothetical protein